MPKLGFRASCNKRSDLEGHQEPLSTVVHLQDFSGMRTREWRVMKEGIFPLQGLKSHALLQKAAVR